MREMVKNYKVEVLINTKIILLNPLKKNKIHLHNKVNLFIVHNYQCAKEAAKKLRKRLDAVEGKDWDETIANAVAKGFDLTDRHW